METNQPHALMKYQHRCESNAPARPAGAYSCRAMRRSARSQRPHPERAPAKTPCRTRGAAGPA
eukprot:3083463-Alexandrium_andersonii.AAC.1